MSLWHRILYWLGIRLDPGPRYYLLDETIYDALQDLAERQQRPPNELHDELIANGLSRIHTQDELWERWHALTPREQDVTALACLGYTNRQIAAKLGVSPETVKTHLRNALTKYNLHGRAELRMLLSNWDFSDWERQ